MPQDPLKIVDCASEVVSGLDSLKSSYDVQNHVQIGLTLVSLT